MAAKKNTDQIKLAKLATGVATGTPASGKDPGVALTNTLASYYNQSVSALRSSGQLLAAIRTLARIHPETSQTVSTITRLANTELRMKVYDENHQLSGDGNNLLRSIVQRMTNLSDYTYGYDDRPSFNSVKERLIRSLMLTGATSMELVLDQARLPFRFQPVTPELLKFKVSPTKIGTSNKIIPFMLVIGETVELDIPTFFYESMDQDLTTAYSNSPLEPAVNIAINSAETLDDMRRAIKRSGHSRMVVKIVTDQLLKSAPPEVRSDAQKLGDWVELQRSSVQSEIEKLSPESALVFFDAMEVDYLNSEIGGASDYQPLVEILDSIQATALKIPLAALGKRTSGGSQNTSSTESLLYLKMASGLHPPVESLLSRALTLAIRLYGFQGYVECKFDPIELRPEIELAAFNATRQANILEQLSLGFLSDDEAAELLHTGPRDPGAPPLSGTMFYEKAAAAAPSPNDTAVGDNLAPSTPSSGGGKSNKSNASGGNSSKKAGRS